MNSADRLKRYTIASIVLAVLIYITCGDIKPLDPVGFGVWVGSCDTIAVAVNQADYDSRLFMNHETNQRCDLHLCDRNGKIKKTVFTERKVGGSPSIIDSLEYNKPGGFIIIYTKRLGTGLVRKERYDLSDESITMIEEFVVWNCCYRNDTVYCDGRGLFWNVNTHWVEVTLQQ